MLQLYFAPLTRSIRIKWLLEELGVEHEIIRRTFDPAAQYAGQDTPAGRFPGLRDGDIELSESGAVVQYILEKYGCGRLEPAIGSPERATYLYWFHYAEASAAVPINQYIGLSVYSNESEKPRTSSSGRGKARTACSTAWSAQSSHERSLRATHSPPRTS